MYGKTNILKMSNLMTFTCYPLETWRDQVARGNGYFSCLLWNSFIVEHQQNLLSVHHNINTALLHLCSAFVASDISV